MNGNKEFANACDVKLYQNSKGINQQSSLCHTVPWGNSYQWISILYLIVKTSYALVNCIHSRSKYWIESTGFTIKLASESEFRPITNCQNIQRQTSRSHKQEQLHAHIRILFLSIMHLFIYWNCYMMWLYEKQIRYDYQLFGDYNLLVL